jgi:DNA gyrase/topoisomerase IV subunit A
MNFNIFKKDDKRKPIAQMNPAELDKFVAEMEKASAELEASEKELNELAETLTQKEESLKTLEKELTERSKKISNGKNNEASEPETKKNKHSAELLAHAKLAKVDKPEKFSGKELKLEIIQRGFPFGVGTATHDLSQEILDARFEMAVEALEALEALEAQGKK